MHFNFSPSGDVRGWSPQTATAVCCGPHQHHTARRAQPQPTAAALLPAAAAYTVHQQRHPIMPAHPAPLPTVPLLCCASTRTPAGLIHCLYCTGALRGCCCCRRLLQTTGVAQALNSTCDDTKRQGPVGRGAQSGAVVSAKKSWGRTVARLAAPPPGASCQHETIGGVG